MSLVRTIAGTSLGPRCGRANAFVILAFVLCVVGLVFWWLRSGDPASVAPPSIPASAPKKEVARTAVPEAAASSSREVIGPEPAVPAPDLLTFPLEVKKSTLVVELVAGGKPASCGSVYASRAFADFREGPGWVQVDPATGTATFRDVPVGNYGLDIHDLPRGWVLPRAFWNAPTLHTVNLTEEGTTFRIELEAGAHVSGSVSLPDGKPVRNLTETPLPEPYVSAWYYDESWKGYVPRETLAVHDGRYEGDVHEGLLVLTVEKLLELRNADPAARILPPAPALRRLPAGSETSVDLRCRAAGSARLAGVALDDQGAPFADLRLDLAQCIALVESVSGETLEWNLADRGARVHTAADGSFHFDGLQPGRHSLTIEQGNCSPLISPERAKIGQFDPPRSLQLGAGETRLELKLRRAQPVHVTGKLEVDPAWAAKHLAPNSFATLMLLYPSDATGEPEKRLHVGYPQPEFAFWVESTLREPKLEFELAGEKLVQPLPLSAGVDPTPLTIHFPR